MSRAVKDDLTRLREGVPEWNEWRNRLGDINTVKFIDADLHGEMLKEADLRNAHISNCTLYNTNLSDAILSGTTIHKTNFRDAKLPNAAFEKSTIKSVDFQHANLDGANFRNAKLDNVDFQDANLSSADFSFAELKNVNFKNTKFHQTKFSHSDLCNAKFTGAQLDSSDFSSAKLDLANLSGASLTNADLTKSSLRGANLSNAKLSGANLTSADLTNATLVDTNFENSTLENCRVYGVSIWNINLTGTKQKNLDISRNNEPLITIDNIEVAQFVHLMLNSKKLRNVIDTVTSKMVLILGRFAPDRKVVLDTIRDELRVKGFVPVIFDFEKPANRNFTETVSTLAHLSRFIIADLSDPRSIPHELKHIIPHLPSVPIQPIIQASEAEYGMFSDYSELTWVLPIYRYKDLDTLLSNMSDSVIAPALARCKKQ